MDLDEKGVSPSYTSGAPDLIDKSVHIEGSYTLSAASGGGSGAIHISTGATLSRRDAALSPAISINRNTSTASVSLAIQYDNWFNALDLAALETATASATNPLDQEVIQWMQNISASIHQR